MAGLAPAIHVWKKKDADARHKAGHDELRDGADIGFSQA
jgi:hypothetical protein